MGKKKVSKEIQLFYFAISEDHMQDKNIFKRTFIQTQSHCEFPIQIPLNSDIPEPS